MAALVPGVLHRPPAQSHGNMNPQRKVSQFETFPDSSVQPPAKTFRLGELASLKGRPGLDERSSSMGLIQGIGNSTKPWGGDSKIWPNFATTAQTGSRSRGEFNIFLLHG